MKNVFVERRETVLHEAQETTLMEVDIIDGWQSSPSTVAASAFMCSFMAGVSSSMANGNTLIFTEELVIAKNR